jgi:hypothetical protein
MPQLTEQIPSFQQLHRPAAVGVDLMRLILLVLQGDPVEEVARLPLPLPVVQQVLQIKDTPVATHN